MLKVGCRHGRAELVGSHGLLVQRDVKQKAVRERARGAAWAAPSVQSLHRHAHACTYTHTEAYTHRGIHTQTYTQACAHNTQTEAYT